MLNIWVKSDLAALMADLVSLTDSNSSCLIKIAERLLPQCLSSHKCAQTAVDRLYTYTGLQQLWQHCPGISCSRASRLQRQMHIVTASSSVMTFTFTQLQNLAPSSTLRRTQKMFFACWSNRFRQQELACVKSSDTLLDIAESSVLC